MAQPPVFARGALAVALLLVCASGFSEPERGSNAEMGDAPRVTIDRPKPTFMLMERDKRIHCLKPFQELVDAAPAGATLKPPPGAYAGPVVLKKPLVIDGGGQVTIDAGDRGTVFSLEADGAVLRVRAEVLAGEASRIADTLPEQAAERVGRAITYHEKAIAWYATIPLYGNSLRLIERCREGIRRLQDRREELRGRGT